MQHVAEAAEAALLLRDGDRQQHLGVRAGLGALGDVAQAVEVEVGAALDGHQRAPVRGVALDPPLESGDAERAGRLGDRPRVLVDVLDRGADLVGADQDHLVDALAGDAKGLGADLFHGDAVGEQRHRVEHDAFAGGQRGVQAVAVLGLDADHAHLGEQRLDVRGDAGDQAAAADRDEDGVDRRRRTGAGSPPRWCPDRR